ncbi:hypothetical protein QTO34_002597 [Cnephaeus nilssonii]|uniref:Uncharacterized protein n=1 Tax=Cnephaeus nilssonii TaxID=3371016 RepID=A0AA40HSK1_CNENI|nr:hypothetical protein QTO34_002597 [Eptesicus nilssonii]
MAAAQPPRASRASGKEESMNRQDSRDKADKNEKQQQTELALEKCNYMNVHIQQAGASWSRQTDKALEHPERPLQREGLSAAELATVCSGAALETRTAFGRRSDRRVARGKLVLAENWSRQPEAVLTGLCCEGAMLRVGLVVLRSSELSGKKQRVEPLAASAGPCSPGFIRKVAWKDVQKVSITALKGKMLTKKGNRPHRCGSVVEHRPLNHEVKVRLQHEVTSENGSSCSLDAENLTKSCKSRGSNPCVHFKNIRETAQTSGRGILWKSHTQGAKEPHVARELQFADHWPRPSKECISKKHQVCEDVILQKQSVPFGVTIVKLVGVPRPKQWGWAQDGPGSEVASPAQPRVFFSRVHTPEQTPATPHPIREHSAQDAPTPPPPPPTPLRWRGPRDDNHTAEGQFLGCEHRR